MGQIPRAGDGDDCHQGRPANVSHLSGEGGRTGADGGVSYDNGLCTAGR